MTDEMRNFIDAALSRVERTPEPEAYGGDGFLASVGEATEAETPEDETPEGWDRFVDSLSTEDLERAKTDLGWAQEQHGLWLTEQAAAAEFADGPDPAEVAVEFRSGGEVAAWIREAAASDPAEFRRTTGGTADEFLARLASLSRREWNEWATANHVDLSAKPSWSQLGAGGQSEAIRRDFANLTPADWRK